MMRLLVERCAAVLAQEPDPVVPASHVGDRVPAGSTELPAVAISLSLDEDAGAGIGRLARRTSDGREIVAERYSGLLALEIWAASSAQLAEISGRLQVRLRDREDGNRSALRALGFAKLQPASLDPASSFLHQPAGSSPFSVWRQKLGYRFVCEVEEVIEPTEGGPIQRIDVAVAGPGSESLSIPPP